MWHAWLGINPDDSLIVHNCASFEPLLRGLDVATGRIVRQILAARWMASSYQHSSISDSGESLGCACCEVAQTGFCLP